MTERSMPVYRWVDEQCREGYDLAGILRHLAVQIDRANHEAMKLQERVQALEAESAERAGK